MQTIAGLCMFSHNDVFSGYCNQLWSSDELRLSFHLLIPILAKNCTIEPFAMSNLSSIQKVEKYKCSQCFLVMSLESYIHNQISSSPETQTDYHPTPVLQHVPIQTLRANPYWPYSTQPENRHGPSDPPSCLRLPRTYTLDERVLHTTLCCPRYTHHLRRNLRLTSRFRGFPRIAWNLDCGTHRGMAAHHHCCSRERMLYILPDICDGTSC
jgi:hypothetical protein